MLVFPEVLQDDTANVY